jgi:hypothetical protein
MSHESGHFFDTGGNEIAPPETAVLKNFLLVHFGYIWHSRFSKFYDKLEMRFARENILRFGGYSQPLFRHGD